MFVKFGERAVSINRLKPEVSANCLFYLVPFEAFRNVDLLGLYLAQLAEYYYAKLATLGKDIA